MEELSKCVILNWFIRVDPSISSSHQSLFHLIYTVIHDFQNQLFIVVSTLENLNPTFNHFSPIFTSRIHDGERLVKYLPTDISVATYKLASDER